MYSSNHSHEWYWRRNGAGINEQENRMMRRWRGSAAVVAATTLALSLSACGSDSGGGSSDGTYTFGVLNCPDW